jgi:hypothetical protein
LPLATIDWRATISPRYASRRLLYGGRNDLIAAGLLSQRNHANARGVRADQFGPERSLISLLCYFAPPLWLEHRVRGHGSLASARQGCHSGRKMLENNGRFWVGLPIQLFAEQQFRYFCESELLTRGTRTRSLCSVCFAGRFTVLEDLLNDYQQTSSGLPVVPSHR